MQRDAGKLSFVLAAHQHDGQATLVSLEQQLVTKEKTHSLKVQTAQNLNLKVVRACTLGTNSISINLLN